MSAAAFTTFATCCRSAAFECFLCAFAFVSTPCGFAVGSDNTLGLLAVMGDNTLPPFFCPSTSSLLSFCSSDTFVFPFPKRPVSISRTTAAFVSPRQPNSANDTTTWWRPPLNVPFNAADRSFQLNSWHRVSRRTSWSYVTTSASVAMNSNAPTIGATLRKIPPVLSFTLRTPRDANTMARDTGPPWCSNFDPKHAPALTHSPARNALKPQALRLSGVANLALRI